MQNRFGVIQAQITNEPLITLSPGCLRQLVVADVNVDIFSLYFCDGCIFFFTLFYLIDDKKVFFFIKKTFVFCLIISSFLCKVLLFRKKCLKIDINPSGKV